MSTNTQSQETTQEPQRRKRGRPRKYFSEEEANAARSTQVSKSLTKEREFLNIIRCAIASNQIIIPPDLIPSRLKTYLRAPRNNKKK